MTPRCWVLLEAEARLEQSRLDYKMACLQEHLMWWTRPHLCYGEAVSFGKRMQLKQDLLRR